MENIEKYIQQIKEYIKLNPDISEDMLVRYVFLDLGKRLSFNMEYIPFGNSKKRQEIYKSGFNINKVDKCLENNIVICNSASKILELVLKELGIKIRTETDKNDIRKYPHVYNIITPKDKEEYIVDLQEDMYRIQMHGFTPNYGISLEDKQVISRFEQEQMDRKLGYIDNENYYTDDYLYLLKYDIDYIEDFYEKVKYILENIETYYNPNINYIDRQWYHVRILEFFFDDNIFNYHMSTGKIRVIDCYKDVDNNRIYINCICVEHKGLTHIFIYNENEYGYEEIEINDFVIEINNGLVISSNTKVKAIEKLLRNNK